MEPNDIKAIIENFFKEELSYTVRVEFVADVSARSREIIQQDNLKWSDAYNANHFLGQFLPDTENHCAYILLQEGREIGMLIESSFHEQKHAIDYVYFLRLIFDGNQTKMINSPLYATFQVYSEFEAKKFGWLQFLKYIDYTNLTKYEQAKSIISCAQQCYDDIDGITNKYQFLMHSVQYLGCLFAVSEYDESYLDLKSEISKMTFAEELNDIITLLDNEGIKDKSWFEEFDRQCRAFIG